MKARVLQLLFLFFFSVCNLLAIDHMAIGIDAKSEDPIEIRDFAVNVQLFTNRTNMAINNIPDGFEDFKFLSSGGGSDLIGTIQATENGRIYIVARSAVSFTGWNKLEGADFTYASNNSPMSVFYKEVVANQVVDIPINTDFRRVTPLAKHITLENTEEFIIDDMEICFRSSDNYKKGILRNNVEYFFNRKYVVHDVPEYLLGYDFLLSDAGIPNDGKVHTGVIIPSRDGEVYVIGRSGTPVPGWKQVPNSEFYYDAVNKGYLALFRKSVFAEELVELPFVDNFQEVRPVAKSILIENLIEIDEMEVTVEILEEDFNSFVKTDFLESAQLFTNRTYHVLGIPPAFSGFEMLTSEGGKEERGVIIPHADGYVYLITRPGGLEDWEEITLHQFYYSTPTPTVMGIYRKKVKANERIELPRTNSFQGVTPLAKKIHPSSLLTSKNNKLESIKVDGEVVSGFQTEKTEYTVLLPHSYDAIPKIEPLLQVSNASYVINQAEDVRGTQEERTAEVIVTSEDGSLSKVYRVLFEVQPFMDLYLCIGQSNMAGYSPLDDSHGDLDQMENVFLLNKSSRFEPAVNPLNRYSTIVSVGAKALLGPAYSFSKAVETRSDNPIGLIVNARGGSAIESWMKNGSGNERDTLYKPTIKRALEAQQWGEFKGIIWHQGEANKADLSQYPQNLQQFVNDLRTDLNISDLPFIAGQIGEFGNNVTEFNELITTISTFIDHADCVSAEGLSNIPGDSNHFGREATLILGERYARSIVAMNYPPDLMHVVIEADPDVFQKRKLEKNINLFLNRPAYTITNSLFSGFENFEFLASNAGEGESGVLIPDRDGKLYIIADKGLFIEGWKWMFDTEIYYTGAELGIYYRQVKKGERIPIPQISNFKGITPLAATIELVEIFPEKDARVKSIIIDGKAFKDFDKDIYEYEVFLPYSVENAPEIVLSTYAEQATYQVNAPNNLNSDVKEDRTVTIVVDSPDNTQQLTYSILFTKLPEMDLFLCIGQSNMAGAAHLDASKGDLSELDNAFLFNADDAFEKAKNGMNRYANILTSTNEYYGLTYQFAKSVTDAVHEKIGLVVNARGGSSIDQWRKNSDNPADTLYQKTIERALEAAKWGKYKAILWHQGEADRNKVSSYPDKLTDLVENLRSELNDSQLLFIAGQLGEWNSTNDDFNRMILGIESFIENSAAVSSQGLINITNLADMNSHFDRDGLKILGERYAKIVLNKVYSITNVEYVDECEAYVSIENNWIQLHDFENSSICALYDVSGHLILQRQTTDNMRVYVEKPGIYILRIVSQHTNHTVKLVI